jgi:hypothetical protein
MKTVMTGIVGATLMIVVGMGAPQAGSPLDYDYINWDQCMNFTGGPSCISYGAITNIIMHCHTPTDCRLYLEVVY